MKDLNYSGVWDLPVYQNLSLSVLNKSNVSLFTKRGKFCLFCDVSFYWIGSRVRFNIIIWSSFLYEAGPILQSLIIWIFTSFQKLLFNFRRMWFQTMIALELKERALNQILIKILLGICSFHKFWTENCKKTLRFQRLITIFFTVYFF